MKLRKATQNDKNLVLDFCHHTFRWGDYIDRVWDSWVSDGNLLTVEINKKPIGICHSSLSKDQVWIEGIRVNPEYRKQGNASALVLKTENNAKKKGKKISRMLIAKSNLRSLKMARSLDYSVEDHWWLYNLKPKKTDSKAKIVSKLPNFDHLLTSSTYSESWEWIPLSKPEIKKLCKKERIIGCFQGKKPTAIGIWNTSSIDTGVYQIGYLSGTSSGMKAILQFVQNMAHMHKVDRIQILAQQKFHLKMPNLDKRMLFCLMKKEL